MYHNSLSCEREGTAGVFSSRSACAVKMTNVLLVMSLKEGFVSRKGTVQFQGRSRISVWKTVPQIANFRREQRYFTHGSSPVLQTPLGVRTKAETALCKTIKRVHFLQLTKFLWSTFQRKSSNKLSFTLP